MPRLMRSRLRTGQRWFRAHAGYLWAGIATVIVGGCVGAMMRSTPGPAPEPRESPTDQIIADGRRVSIGTRVVTWQEPGGLSGYSIAGGEKPSYDARPVGFAIDQFVVHFDATGTARRCFDVLRARKLSVHFLLDLDGTIYQTLDTRERAWHATKANARSIGIEIANLGSVPLRDSDDPFSGWYRPDPNHAAGRTSLTVPETLGGLESQLTRPTQLRPAREGMIVGTINGVTQRQYDFTPQQYRALCHLLAALCETYPEIQVDAPRDAGGAVLMRTLRADEFDAFRGILGHYHVQANKSDPGPAFQWEAVLQQTRRLIAQRKSGS